VAVTEHDLPTICSEIAVAVYGTRIVGEKDGWPLCIHPLEECRDDGSGTLHTYRYAPVPRYHDRADHLDQIMTYLEGKPGWVFGSRTNGKWERRRTVVWVNKPPFAPNRSLVKTSIRAFGARWAETVTLAIHKALMMVES
jgi:hypothetical protein